MFDLTGKTALVTGGSRGIGSGIAIRLAAAGAKVFVHYNSSKAGADAVVDAIQAAGGDADPIGGDVSDSVAVTAMFAAIADQGGQIDILVNNAGVNVQNHLIRMKDEGRTPPPYLPMTPGHQVVGSVVDQGPACKTDLMNKRVGIAWIHSACGDCQWCLSGRENLCPDFCACGRDTPGGYAEYMSVPESFAYIIPDQIDDQEATPLLCAGAVGYRSLRLCQLENGQNLGLTGFGASGHLVLQIAQHLYPDSHFFVFARSAQERAFAAKLGASLDRKHKRPA